MPRRKRNTHVELVSHLERAARTGQSLVAYASDHDLDVQRLYNARWQLRAQGLTLGFVRVEVRKPVASPVPMPVAIQLPNGITITAPMATELADLVRTLLPL